MPAGATKEEGWTPPKGYVKTTTSLVFCAARKRARSVSLSEGLVGQTHETLHRGKTNIPLILVETEPLIRIVSLALGVCKTTTFTNKPDQIFCKTALSRGLTALYRMTGHTLSRSSCASCVILLFLGNTVYLFSDPFFC